MTATQQLDAVLAAYPAECRPAQVESLGAAGGFSGARFWRLATPRGRLCLRRWSVEHPTPDRLELIHGVLLHVARAGFGLVPAPVATRAGATFVCHEGHLWELTPWMPGVADYHAHPTAERLRAALRALAAFHVAASSFAASPQPLTVSPGIDERLHRLRQLRDGGCRRIAGAIDESVGRELAERARGLVELFPQLADDVARELAAAAPLEVPLQPVIRDVWHDHVLFEGDRVTGLVDFGAIRVDSVATDIARLLGSLAVDDPNAWRTGLSAYESRRALSPAERQLVAAFDSSSVLLSGFNWLEWLYVDRRRFENPEPIVARLDDSLRRMACRVVTGTSAAAVPAKESRSGGPIDRAARKK